MTPACYAARLHVSDRLLCRLWAAAGGGTLSQGTRVPWLGCPVSDNCVHTWCMACSLLQEGNELDMGVLPTWNELHGGRSAAGGSTPQPEPRRPGPTRLIPRGQEARLNSTQVIFR